MLFLFPEIVELQVTTSELSCSLNVNISLRFSLVWSYVVRAMEGGQQSCIQCSSVAVIKTYTIL